MFKNLIINWSFIWELVKREIKSRYAGSILGLFWAILSPAVIILVFVLIFSNIMAMRFGPMGEMNTYVIFLCSGILPWNAFQSTIQRSSTIFIEYSNLVKKAVFPKEILVAQIVLASVPDLIIGLSILVLILTFLAHSLSVPMLLLPLVILFQIIFSFGLSLILSTLTVFFRDLSHLTGLILFLWFWLTPIVYPLRIIPEKFQFLIKLNPFTHLLDIYRNLLLHSNLPNASSVLFFLVVLIITLAIGTRLFNRLKEEIPDEV